MIAGTSRLSLVSNPVTQQVGAMSRSYRGRALAALVFVGAFGAGIPDGQGRPSYGFVVPGQRPPRHIALIIGIGDYKNFIPSGPPGNSDLNGPPNDIELIRSTLRSRLFENPEDIRILRDSAASRAGIQAGFRWLIERANDPGDIVVVFYSGHGSNAPDQNGDEARVTPGDHKDEGLVPWDVENIHDPAQLILDDDIGTWLDSLKTRNVTVIIDACFSGTITRGGDQTGDTRARGPLESSSDSVPVISTSTGFRGRGNYTLITASSANEVAQEKPLGAEGQVYGVLTYYLTQAMRGAGPTTRYDELFQELIPQVKGKSNQSPQLEGDRGALLLSEKQEIPARAFVQVTPVGGGRFRIDEGAVQGVRKSAVYDLYPDGSKAFTGQGLAPLLIDSLEPLAAFGRLADTTRRVAAPTRGVLARLPRGATMLERIPVLIDPAAPALRDALDHMANVEVRLQGDAAVRIAPWGRGYMVFANDVPLLPQESERENLVAGPGDSLGYLPTTKALCAPITRALAIQTLQQLRNPEPIPGLGVEVRVLPFDQSPGYSATSVDTLVIGQPVGVWVKVTASSRSTWYVSLAVMGYSSSPTMLFPFEGIGEDAGGRIQPIELNKWVRLPLPDDLAPSAPAGLEVLKVMVDSDQYSLRPLVESFDCGGIRGDFGRESSVVQGWTTLERRLMIVVQH